MPGTRPKRVPVPSVPCAVLLALVIGCQETKPTEPSKGEGEGYRKRNGLQAEREPFGGSEEAEADPRSTRHSFRRTGSGRSARASGRARTRAAAATGRSTDPGF